MKKTILLISVILIINTLLSQSCLPDGIVLNTQTAIDSFQINFPDCIEIEGDLYITGNDIKNLNGLVVLTTIGGNLTIINNDSLVNLMGLNNLISINGGLAIGGVDGIENLFGLSNLTTVNGIMEIVFNDRLINLSGIDSLSFIGWDFLIHTNPILTGLIGIENLSAIGGGLSIHDNSNLMELTGLENLLSINGHLTINGNAILESLNGISNIYSGSITNLNISENVNLSTCEVKSICDYLSNPNGIIEIYDNSYGCMNQSEVEVACIVGTLNRDLDSKISIYPNPAYNKLFISNHNGLTTIEITIYNQLGQKVLSKDKISNGVDISMIKNGIYIIELVSKDESIRKKLIIK